MSHHIQILFCFFVVLVKKIYFLRKFEMFFPRDLLLFLKKTFFLLFRFFRKKCHFMKFWSFLFLWSYPLLLVQNNRNVFLLKHFEVSLNIKFSCYNKQLRSVKKIVKKNILFSWNMPYFLILTCNVGYNRVRCKVWKVFIA